jgi:hypothetical protein
VRRVKPKPRKATPKRKELVLKALRTGISINASCKKAGVSVSTFATWRKKDEIYGAKVKEILDTPAQKARLHSRKTVSSALPDAGWKVAYSRAIADGKSRTEVLDILGLSATDVQKAIEEDEEFASSLQEIELRELWDIEDKFKTRAHKSSADARFILTTFLSEKYGASKPPPAKGTKPLFTSEGLQSADEWLDEVAHKPRGKV